MLIAAYCQRTGMALDTLASYLQTRQQRGRAAGPWDGDQHEVAGMLGGPLQVAIDSARDSAGQWRHPARPTASPQTSTLAWCRPSASDHPSPDDRRRASIQRLIHGRVIFSQRP
ncbi:hypothetical protein ACFZC7_40265 [Streptomyces massasporeus]|uniref:hypothetical protein n=1 Tax=Streptomyces massasporeus TaxID=67324 RepID=UPI0036E42ABE